MTYRTARLILGTHSCSTYTDIKRAFRQKALERHPDHNPSRHAAETFSHVVEAYRCLMTHRSTFQRTRYLSKQHRGVGLALMRPGT